MLFFEGGEGVGCCATLLLFYISDVRGDAFVGLTGRSCEVCYGMRQGRRSRVCPQAHSSQQRLLLPVELNTL